MRFSVFLSLIAGALAYNDVTAPATNAVIQEGGGVYTVSWNNQSGSSVTLTLYRGSNGALTAVDTIASGVTNSGTYAWNVPNYYPTADDYLIQISADGVESSYSKYFTLQLCSTCSSSSTALSYSGDAASTVSVAASVIGTRSESSTSSIITSSVSASSSESASSASATSSSDSESSSAASSSESESSDSASSTIAASGNSTSSSRSHTTSAAVAAASSNITANATSSFVTVRPTSKVNSTSANGSNTTNSTTSIPSAATSSFSSRGALAFAVGAASLLAFLF